VSAVALLLVVALLLGNAFFVAAEFALVSVRPDQLEPRAEAGSARAQRTLAAMRRVSTMMAAAQLGITLCSLGLGAVGEPAVAHLIEAPLEAAHVPEGLLHPIALVVALALVTGLHMVLGEMVPKNVTIAGPDRAALLLGPPLAVVARLLAPVIWLVNTLANGFVRLFGVQPVDEVEAGYDAAEIRSMVTRSEQRGVLDEPVGELAAGALTFEQHGVDAVLLPAADLVTVPRSTTPRQLEAVVAEHGFSRYPVCGEQGGWCGYVHVKDVLDLPGRDSPLPDDVLTPFLELDTDEGLPEVLTAMRDTGRHLGRVGDGSRTLGVVALEDVLETLIGDVRDAAVERADQPAGTRVREGTGAGGR
jgi:CBS domain containing-hemolysin-like protein